MAKERPTSRLLARRSGSGGDLKWLRDLTENKPESRDPTRMPAPRAEESNYLNIDHHVLFKEVEDAKLP